MIYTDFSVSIRKMIDGDRQYNGRSAIIGTPSSFLSKCGVDSNQYITVTKNVISKAMRCEIRDSNGRLKSNTGHGLSFELIIHALQELDFPPLVFKGSAANSLLIITTVPNEKMRNIVIAMELNRCEGFSLVNSIRSIYGRDNLSFYISKNIDEGKLIGINKNKADEMLRSIGKSYPKENTFISCE